MIYSLCQSEVFITQSFSRLETEMWRCGTSRESRNTSGRTVFHLGTWTEPRPRSTWAFLARTGLTEKAFPTELKDRRKQSGVLMHAVKRNPGFQNSITGLSDIKKGLFGETQKA